MSFGNGDMLAPIAGATAVHLDGSTSRGIGLSCFLEFGDGFVATAPQAAHTVDAPARPAVTARLTVVDAYGRSDTEAIDFRTFDLGVTSEDGFESGFWTTGSKANGEPLLWIALRRRSGNQFTGVIADQTVMPLQEPPVSATVTGDGTQIHLSSAALGIEWEGTISVAGRSPWDATLTLVQRGGRDDGHTYVLHFFASV
jgi:hypothetical protein